MAGGESRHWLIEATSPDKEKEEVMKMFLAGVPPRRDSSLYDDTIKKEGPYILESFYYADADTERLLPLFGDFMLDSGAFTFMSNAKVKVEWEDYLERYADFVKRNRIQKYFELDIDSVVGYEKVLQMRQKLEKLVGWPCIPVWHASRGIDEYKRMCDEYGYVAIGGIVSKEITRKMYGAFPSMITEAHQRGAKVHGLGFTNLALLPRIHFDSVDSTAWTAGNRFGYIYYFDGKTMKKIEKPIGSRVKKNRWLALNNFSEWVKYQKYAEKQL